MLSHPSVTRFSYSSEAYANFTSRVRVYPTYPISSTMNFPPGPGLRQPRGEQVQRRDAEDRRDHVSRHRQAAQRRDDRRQGARHPDSLPRRDGRVPRSRPAVGRVEHGPDVRGRHSDARARERRTESREGNPAPRAGPDDFRIVELDVAVRETRSRSTTTSRRRAGYSTGSSISSSASGTTRRRAVSSNRSRSYRCRPTSR